MDATQVCSYRPCNAKFHSHYDLSKHEAVCRYRNRFIFKQAVESHISGQSVAEDVDHCGYPFAPDDAATSDLRNVAKGHNETESKAKDLFRAAELVLQIKREASSRLSEEVLSFLQTSALTTSEYKEHLFNLSACQKQYNTAVQDKLLGLQMKCEAVLCDSGDGSEEQHVFYMKDAEEVLRNQFRLATDEQVHIRPSTLNNTAAGNISSEYPSHPMTTEYAISVYNCVKKDILRSVDETVFWQDNVADVLPSFVGMLQVYTDKTALSLKANASVAYPVHLVPLNFSKQFRRFLIDHGHTLVALLPVATSETSTDGEDSCPALKQADLCTSTVVPLSDELPTTSSRGARDMKLKVLYEAMHKILGSLNKNAQRGFPVSICGRAWKCHPTITSYCCDTPEGKDMSGVKHGGTLHPCIRCLVCRDDISALVRGAVRYEMVMCSAYNKRRALLDEAAALHRRGQKILAREKREQSETALNEFSLNIQEGMLASLSLTNRRWPNDRYAVFSVEPLHVLHLGISKKLKECTVAYLSSDIEAFPPPARSTCKRLSTLKNQLLTGCNNLLMGYKYDFLVSNLQVDFSSSQKSSRLNGFFTSTGVKGMLEGKDFCTLDTVFPFLAAFIDRVTGYITKPILTRVHTTYSDIVNHLLYGGAGLGLRSADSFPLIEKIELLSRSAKAIFGSLDDVNLFTLKFHMLHHIAEDVQRFGDVGFLDGSPFEHFNFVIKSFMKMTSLRKGSTMDEAVQAMNASRDKQKWKDAAASRTRAAGLTREGFRITLSGFLDCSSSIFSHLTKDAKQSFLSCLLEYVRDSQKHFERTPTTTNILLTVVKSGYIHGGANVTLADYDEKQGHLRHNIDIANVPQRVFADCSFGPTKSRRFSVVLLRGDEHSYWFAHVLLLFHAKSEGDPDSEEELAFVQYFEVTPPMDDIDRELQCLSLRWATDDEIDHSIDFDPSRSSLLEAGEWYGVVPFSSIVSVHHIVRANYSVTQFCPKLPWPAHRFYVNRFYQYRLS